MMKIPRLTSVKCTIKDVISRKNHPLSRQQSTFIADAVAPETLERAKSFCEIPGPKPLPLFKNVHRYLPIIGEYSKNEWHESQRKKFEQYGPIVREEMPGLRMVHLFDPKDMEVVSWNEGKYPRRDFFLAMRHLREQNPHIYSSAGVAASNGESWHQIRRKSQPPMLKPKIMRTYLPQMNIIADDLIKRVRELRQADHQVPNFMNELFKWALESVTYILFNQRMGCLNEKTDSLGQKYIQAVNDFFLLTGKVEMSSFPIWRVFPNLSPSFQRFKKVHDFFFEQAMEYVTTRMKDIKPQQDNKSLIEMLVENGSPKDASIMAVDAMAAGIDTTSLTMAYVLRNLANNPSVQQKLQEEVDRYLPNGQALTVETLDKLHYLKACIKESMRLCPTVQGTSRTLDKDIVLSGYRVPAKTMMTLNYNVSSVQESHFKDALVYRPERWLRDSKGTFTANEESSFAFVPFGFGPRMCIGRRIAELEIFTLLTKMMQNFWIENHSNEMRIRFQLVLMITSPLRYEFKDRKKQL